MARKKENAMQQIPVLLDQRLKEIELSQKRIIDLLSKKESNHIVEKKYLSAEEAADYLNMPTGSLYNHTMKGTIKFHKLRRKLYFLQGDLDQFVTGKTKNQ